MRSFIQNAVNNSIILTCFRSSDDFQKLWNESMLFHIINLILNKPLELLRKLFGMLENVVNNSITAKAIKYCAEKIHIIIGLILVLNMIIPDHRWYNKYGVALVFMLLAVFILKLIVEPKSSIDMASFDYTAILFFLCIFLAGITSLFPKESLNYIIYYFITFVFMVILISSVNSYDDLNVIIKFIAAGVFITAVYGIYQWKVVGVAVNPSQTDLSINQDLGGRIFSTMGNPNIYGELLVLTIPLFGPIILNEKRLLKKAVWAAMLLPLVLVLFKTGSRAAWGAVAAAVLIFVFFWNKRLLPIIIVLGIISVPFLPSSIYKRILTVFNPNDNSMSYRAKIMNCALVMLKDYWVTGVGLGSKTVGFIFQRYKGFGLTTVAHTHNIYIQIWLEAGIFAIVSLLTVIFRLIKNTFAAVRAKKNPAVNNILIASLSAVIGLLIVGAVDHVWFYNRIMFMFWIDAAIGFTAIKLLKRQAG